MPNLYGKEFVFLFDDSGSMRNTDPGAQMSRWMELKEYAASAIALSSAFDQDGVDVYFLNRPKCENIKSIQQLQQVFFREPTDYCLTPLSQRVDQILQEKRNKFLTGNLVLCIATDGEPRSQDGSDSVETFTRLLKCRHQRIGAQSLAQIPVNIRACTNDVASVGYLNKLDSDDSLSIDVTDDYVSELQQIQSVLGRDFQFSYGDHTLKSLMGACDPWMVPRFNSRTRLTNQSSLLSRKSTIRSLERFRKTTSS
jgi:hypothetical protein